MALLGGGGLSPVKRNCLLSQPDIHLLLESLGLFQVLIFRKKNDKTQFKKKDSP